MAWRNDRTPNAAASTAAAETSAAVAITAKLRAPTTAAQVGIMP
jgi:hypothetical protein